MATINTEALQADFDAFEISEELGFILKKPLMNLPLYYRVWLDLANNLTPLIESRKLRDLVHEMPVLSPHLLSSHRELRLAQLVLGFITMGYVWQNGRHAPAQILPTALAWPYWLVSCRLGLPPILTYADSVLANWKLKDPKGAMEIGNMDLIVSLPGALMVMHFSGWGDNPMLPTGLLYKGVSNQPISLSGCSAAQSSAFQCFDALLCIRPEDETGAYLTRMRDLKPPAHSQLIETLSALPPLRDLISSCSSSDLCQAYNTCVSALVDLRSYHLNTVTKYLGGVATLKGTGGSNLMVFLKSAHKKYTKITDLRDVTCVKKT